MVPLLLPNGWEWIIILLVILLLFGNRLPGLARSLGSGITEFKKGLKGDDNQKSLPPGQDAATPPARETPQNQTQGKA